MKIYIRTYKEPTIGNYSTDLITIPSNQISVLELKQLLYDKYHIDKSQQRLTYKMCNQTIVTLTNEWPLSFFYIRQNSIIYLEFIQVITKSEEISKKVLTNVNSKYMTSLRLFRYVQQPPMGTINESQNEYLDEFKPKHISNNYNYNQQKVGSPHSTNSYKSYESNNDVSEIINMLIKGNKVSQFKELIEQYDNNSYDVNEKWKGGWAPIHYAAFHGFIEIFEILINKCKANVNLVSNDGWSALHLASYKGHKDIVDMLISSDDIQVNLNLPKIGTALHCACKKNNLQIVSLLSHKANLHAKDDDGFEPFELATDKNVKNLLRKLLNPIEAENNRKERRKVIKENQQNEPIVSSPIKQYTSEQKETNTYQQKIISNNSQPKDDNIPLSIRNLKFIPPNVPKTIGFADKRGLFLFNYNHRYLEIDTSTGSFRRYASKSNYPDNPIEIIPLIDIVACNSLKPANDWYFMELIYKQRQVYCFPAEHTCSTWVTRIMMATIYAKFWKGKQEADPSVTNYLVKQEVVTEEIDFDTGEIKRILPKVKEIPNETSSNLNNNSNNNFNFNKLHNTDNNNKLIHVSSTLVKKQRRQNPYTSMEKDVKLFENITLSKGITFQSFEIIECLGAGTFGKVFKVRCKFNGEIYAMKAINKNYLIRNQQMRYAVTECNVLKQANSPFIITLHYAFQTPENLYMIIDYCPGGDLNYHIIQNLFDEDEAKFFIAELVLGIEHLHSLDIIYRDLKPENILIAIDGHIKLADFGLAKEGIDDFQTSKSFCGSPAYLAPEMLNRRGVGKSADIYGIGAVLYEMVSGSPPFYANDMKTMYNNINRNNLMFHDYFSEELKDLLKQLLNRDPKNRIGVRNKDEIKSHPFFADIDWDKLLKKKIKPPIDLVSIKKEQEEEYECKTVSIIDKDYNDNNMNVRRVKQFTFVRPASPPTSNTK